MLDPIPERFERERRSVEAQIREAFRGVKRERGVSWSESVVVDGDGSGRTREEARARDTEGSWEELVDDPSWNHEVGVGGFNFLDPIGFRYCIAPAMIRCLGRYSEPVLYALTVDGDFKRQLVSLIESRQAMVVARFIRLMIATDRDEPIRGGWQAAYDSYWRRWDPEADAPASDEREEPTLWESRPEE